MAGTVQYRFDTVVPANQTVPVYQSRALPQGVLRRIRIVTRDAAATGSGIATPSNIWATLSFTSDAAGLDVILRPFQSSVASGLQGGPYAVPVPPGDLGLLWEGRFYLPPGTWVFLGLQNYDLNWVHAVFPSLEVDN